MPFFAEDAEGLITYVFGIGLVRFRDGQVSRYPLRKGSATLPLPMPFMGLRARDGRLWFATSAGALVIDPHRIRRNAVPPPVLIEDVVADGRPRGTGQGLTLEAGTTRIEVHYTGLSLFAPEKVRFKFRLEGFERYWIDAGAQRVAYYTNLPPGSYRFRVIAANNDGVWNEQGASLSIRQLPRFYQTAWFVAATCLAAASILTGALRLRTRQHRRRERELSRRVEESLAQIKTLRGLLPVCAWCKKVRDDGGYWSELEEYVQRHTETAFSHGICPECRERRFAGDVEAPPGSPD